MVSGFRKEFVVVNWITAGVSVEKPRHLFPRPQPAPTPLLWSRQMCEMYEKVCKGINVPT